MSISGPKEWDGEPSELCRMPRGHECWIRCNERSDTHYDPPSLRKCPLCKTDNPQITWNQDRYPEIFCRGCGIALTECDIPSLIRAWNTRAETAELTALRDENEWRDIESAPRDDTEILLIWADGHQQIDSLSSGESSFWYENPPTHWRPLPAPPLTTTETEGK